jgi:hypothetical protein
MLAHCAGGSDEMGAGWRGGGRGLVRGVVWERSGCVCPDVAAYIIGMRGLQVRPIGLTARFDHLV